MQLRVALLDAPLASGLCAHAGGQQRQSSAGSLRNPCEQQRDEQQPSSSSLQTAPAHHAAAPSGCAAGHPKLKQWGGGPELSLYSDDLATARQLAALQSSNDMAPSRRRLEAEWAELRTRRVSRAEAEAAFATVLRAREAVAAAEAAVRDSRWAAVDATVRRRADAPRPLLTRLGHRHRPQGSYTVPPALSTADLCSTHHCMSVRSAHCVARVFRTVCVVRRHRDPRPPPPALVA